MRVKYNDMAETRQCENCDQSIPLFAYKEHLVVCKRDFDRSCDVPISKVVRNRKKRKCLVCGKDPFPNYFYCAIHQPEEAYYEY